MNGGLRKWISRIEKGIRYVLIFVVAWLFIANIVLLIFGESVPGKVVDFYSESIQDSKRSRTIHRPVFEYAYNGTTDWRIQGKFGQKDIDYKLGDSAEILVNRLNPNHGEVNSFMDLWFLPILWTSVLAILLVFKRVITKMFGVNL